MPKRDAYHANLRHALEKDGWHVTHDPLTIRHKGLRVYIDLAAERFEPASQKPIAVEIKVFGGPSRVDNFERAIGQYDLYRTVLQDAQIERELFLAISQNTWDELSKVEAFRFHLRVRQIHVIIFDPVNEEVTAWIRQPTLSIIENL